MSYDFATSSFGLGPTIQIFYVCQSESDARQLAGRLEKSRYTIDVHWIRADLSVETRLREQLGGQVPPLPTIIVLDGSSLDGRVWSILNSLRGAAGSSLIEFVVVDACPCTRGISVDPMPNLTVVRTLEVIPQDRN